MAKQPPKWVGNTTQFERGKATWDFQAEKTTVSFSYSGKMLDCLSRRPKIGGVIPEFNTNGLVVASCQAVEGDGDSGELKVVLEATIAPGDEVSFAPIGEPIYEIDWGQLEKPIETHLRCGILNPSRPYYEGGVAVDPDPDSGVQKGKQRTWEDWADLTDDDYIQTGAWDLDTYQAIKEKGVDSYGEPAPIVRRTIYYNRPPSGVGADVSTKQEPPSAAGFSGGGVSWEFLLTADRLTKEGRKRTRVTEWTGAREVDENIYD